MISTTRSIPAPPAEVYAALADVAHWPDWLDTVDELHLLEGATSPPAVGDRAGPAVAFTARVPSAGTYRLFFQFRVADVMHTAEFTVPTRNP